MERVLGLPGTMIANSCPVFGSVEDKVAIDAARNRMRNRKHTHTKRLEVKEMLEKRGPSKPGTTLINEYTLKIIVGERLYVIFIFGLWNL